eukprot:Nitzschia sp. Nitz4//scaffold19_size178191//46688//47298//NITZ4_001964-RA/size178191-augustus-gene-0.47-mRNA-1//1//CDS//3329540640//8662//frame0
MVADMSYSTVSSVIDSWEEIRRLPDHEEKTGCALFLKLFELEPDARTIFGFEKDTEMTPEMVKSPRFVKHAKYFIQMIDKALGMLGPDIELLTEILLDLGAKHVGYGVKPEYYPSMGRALIHAVKQSLGDGFTDEMKDAWVEVYGALSYDMIRAQKIKR